MKNTVLIITLLLTGCTDIAKVQTIEGQDSCSKKCKKPYTLGSKYQGIQRQKRCKQRCQNKIES